ncbi:Putative glycoside hydrolase family 31, galactose mutarotase-like domain superfamily [Colletotrichum destructivum]|uniref:alpha-glucosidase n=1 Tax=Colletotrichum destructivum TaxID=34406 RepID=A0AAX4INZ7_9PEZI|nr:Putative glycoside hydrolase family 31, galactose mutarotase-like domain superfamily [Colletotrichum destructivum]
MLLQSEKIPSKYAPQEAKGAASTASIELQSSDGQTEPFTFTFEVVRPTVFRTTVTSKSRPIPPFPSAHKPVTDSAPTDVEVKTSENTQSFTTSAAKAVVEWSNTPIVSLYAGHDDSGKPIHADLPFRSYAADGPGIAHYSVYKKGTLHVGLGEKAAPMDLSGRGFLISASDTFGYDAYRTDPLYKHIPLLINVTREGAVGIFSTAHSRSTWSIGSELDGMWGAYKVHRQSHGGLEEYLIVGSTVADVVRSYAELVGFPLRVPRYMMGYIGGGMKYSAMDAPRAHDAIMGWVKNCEKHDIPFSAFQMSSGYTVAEKEPKTRNVFTWNYHRFPDPRAFTREAHAHGVRLLANVKPYVLATHPEYKKLSAAGAFFKDPNTGETAVTRLWSAGGGESGEGSHLDFTSNAGYQWWYDGVVGLKKVGIDVMWNDNNEYTVPDDDWQCALEKTDLVPIPEGLSRKDVGIWGRAIHTELMGKASHDATIEGKPEERPFVLTRSATAGTMKYCGASWSGDNVTAWESMRGGNSLALNASFSLLHCYGHDIGGFEGPQPTPEHLVRWIQLGVHSPRFAINCFKTSEEDNLIGGVIEPWMYPTATPIIRATIKRRYELVPYTYSQNLRAHHTAVPPQRWTGWGYEADPEVWTKEIKNGDTQYWFGDAFVIGGVYEPGADTARVYLPKRGDGSDFGFLNTNAPYEHLEAGRWHTVLSPWYTCIPVLARVGAAVPVGRPLDTTSRAETDPEFPNQAKDDWRGVEIFPPPALRGSAAAAAAVGGSDAESGADDVKGVVFEDSWYEDDGISREVAAEYKFSIRYEIVDGRISVEVKGVVTEGSREGWSPLWLEKGVDVVLPVGEERSVVTQGGEAVEKTLDAKGRRVWNISVSV